jgi:thioredoxin 1
MPLQHTYINGAGGIRFAAMYLFTKYLIMPTVYLSTEDFKEKVFNYETEQDWNYKGSLPAIIDFYAEWCGPCKAIAPVLEELSNEYDGKLMVYKIDTDVEAELSSLFGIQSIPTLLFIPLQGELMVQRGAVPKNVLKQVIEERLLQAAPKES